MFSKFRLQEMSPAVLQQLKTPSFNIWLFKEEELIHLIRYMFVEFNLLDSCGISNQVFWDFMQTVRHSYNKNPFHNFQHCFCVTQMVRQ